jgi:hypothetical protein
MLKRNSKYNMAGTRRFKIVLGLLLIIMNISFAEVFGQKARSEAPPLRERLFYGGSLGLQFGTYTDIDVSPVIGLWVLPRLNVAAGPKYRYQKYYEEKANMYGGRVYSEFFFIRDINNMIPLGVHLGFFLHAEYEFFKIDINEGVGWESHFINAPLAGVGISQPLGMRSSMNLMLLWALEDYYDFYSDPEIRISIIF